MNSFKKPVWLLLCITLPQFILFLLWASSYKIIHSLLSDANKHAWWLYGSFLVIPFIVITVYGIIQHFKIKEVSLFLAIPMLCFYVAYLYIFMNNMELLVSRDVPSWMFFDGDLVLFTFSLIMPAIAYFIFLAVAHFTPAPEEDTFITKNLLIAIFIPLAWYFVLNATHSVFFDENVSEHIFFILFISSTILFFFFLLRFFYLLTMQRSGYPQSRIVLRILFALVLPILGLLVNQGFLFDRHFMENHEGMFGNLSSPWFYILTVINFGVLCLPTTNDIRLSKLFFFLRASTYSYTLFFFFIFLPFLPLSILAIIIFGTGFLMLTPVILMSLHTSALYNDYIWLKASNAKPLRLLVAGILLIPAVITISYEKDKLALNKALDYVYSYNFSAGKDHISKPALKSALQHIRRNKNNVAGDFFMDSERTPYLSFYYNWLVLDNLTLSEDKMSMLNKIFFGDDHDGNDNENYFDNVIPLNAPDQNVKCNSVNYKTTYLADKGYYKSDLELTIINDQNNSRPGEYIRAFHLPAGVYISGFSLDIDGKIHKGILAESRTSSWIYNQVVNTNKDPAIISYIDLNTIGIKIFPVQNTTPRKVFLTLIHSEPFTFNIDHCSAYLNALNGPLIKSSVFQTKNIAFVPASVKPQLPLIKRKPYLHIFADCSVNSNYSKQDVINTVKKLSSAYGFDSISSKISLVDYKVRTYGYNDFLKKHFRFTHEGGYFLERAFEIELKKNYDKGGDSYPVLVALTGTPKDIVYTKPNNILQVYLPESQSFYISNLNGIYEKAKILNNSQHVTAADILPTVAVRQFNSKENKRYYLTNDSSSSYVIKTTTGKVEFSGNIYEKAHQLITATFMNNTSENWHNVLSGSFKTGIMTPFTSYISLENQAQQDALMAKQDKVLNSGKDIDLEEKTETVDQSMSEPGWYVFAIIALLFFIWSKRKKMQFA